MTLPNELQLLIDAALIHVRNRTDTIAVQDFVVTIGDFFGDLLVNAPRLSRSQKRRIVLTVLTVRQALPAWEQTWPADQAPHHFLSSITRTVLYNFTSEQVNDLAEQTETWLNPYLAKKEKPTLRIGYSLSTILDALTAITDGLVIDNRTPNQQMTVAMLMAADAYAQGAILDTTFSSDRWFAFWELWLCHSVPMVWMHFPNLNQGTTTLAG